MRRKHGFHIPGGYRWILLVAALCLTLRRGFHGRLYEGSHRPRITIQHFYQFLLGFRVLNSTSWHKGEACRILGISRPRLRRIIKQHGLVDPGGSVLEEIDSDEIVAINC
ncbi:MAG: hypothetical protein GY815_18255 [Gammaproteobacteria bacterium]|nr:hypothetical protein [Gammaproteobacteria bacterium]